MNADIDIDTPASFDPTQIFSWLRASMVKDGVLSPHPCGVHPQTIPKDPISGLAAIPYKQAQEHDYFKIDFLHLGVYDNFSSREEIDALLELEPDWSLLTDEVAQQKLFQLSKHGDILNVVQPKNIEELADVLALIRPGKRQLLKLYMAHRESTRRILYAKDEHGYSFKKSHSIAYALVIKLQLLLIQAGVL
jgi:hypothetical protein